MRKKKREKGWAFNMESKHSIYALLAAQEGTSARSCAASRRRGRVLVRKANQARL